MFALTAKQLLFGARQMQRSLVESSWRRKSGVCAPNTSARQFNCTQREMSSSCATPRRSRGALASGSAFRKTKLFLSKHRKFHFCCSMLRNKKVDTFWRIQVCANSFAKNSRARNLIHFKCRAIINCDQSATSKQASGGRTNQPTNERKLRKKIAETCIELRQFYFILLFISLCSLAGVCGVAFAASKIESSKAVLARLFRRLLRKDKLELRTTEN